MLFGRIIKQTIFILLLFHSASFAQEKLNQLPAQEELSPYWSRYFAEVDVSIEENFWGSLAIFKKTALYRDPYIVQMQEMGYNFNDGEEEPAPFYASLSWVITEINRLIEQGSLSPENALWPAKAFEVKDENDAVTVHFVSFGGEVPKDAKPLNLLTPDIFVQMLGEGYFPISEPIREHTNQTLAEHDLAHMAGFISNPRYMAAIRECFRRVAVKMENNSRVYKPTLSSLQN